MDIEALSEREEAAAYIHGWDFSRVHGRYEGENDLPWDYEAIVRQVLEKDARLLDCDTGGGEFLLSLRHPYANAAATEGYPPNAALCRERLLPLGIVFRECADPSKIPFADGSFDLIINRPGDFNAAELRWLPKKAVCLSRSRWAVTTTGTWWRRSCRMWRSPILVVTNALGKSTNSSLPGRSSKPWEVLQRNEELPSWPPSQCS